MLEQNIPEMEKKYSMAMCKKTTKTGNRKKRGKRLTRHTETANQTMKLRSRLEYENQVDWTSVCLTLTGPAVIKSWLFAVAPACRRNMSTNDEILVFPNRLRLSG